MKTNLSKSHIKDTVTYKNINDRISGQLIFSNFITLGCLSSGASLQPTSCIFTWSHQGWRADLSYFHQVPLTKQLQLFVLEFIICGKHCSITGLPGTDVTAVLLNTNKLVSLIPDDKRRQATPSTWLVVSNPHIASAASVGCPRCHVVIHQQLVWIRASLASFTASVHSDLQIWGTVSGLRQ